MPLLKPPIPAVWVNVPSAFAAAAKLFCESMAEYEISVVEYRHVALSFVFKESVADAVPAAKTPEGEPAERDGGVVSGLEGAEDATLNSMGVLVVFAFPKAS